MESDGALAIDFGFSNVDRCPNCNRTYSREWRISVCRDEEYCCDWCKKEAEAFADEEINRRAAPTSNLSDGVKHEKG